jgi:hypothetical protein
MIIRVPVPPTFREIRPNVMQHRKVPKLVLPGHGVAVEMMDWHDQKRTRQNHGRHDTRPIIDR